MSKKTILLVALLEICAPMHAAAQGAGGAPQARGISAQAQTQIEALVADKLARTPAQRKIHSKLIYAARRAAGRPAAPGVPAWRGTMPTAADGRVLLDVRATVSQSLVDRLRSLGAEVTATDARYRHIGVRAPLRLVEAIAALPDVDRITPDVGFRTSRSPRRLDRATFAGSLQDAITNLGTTTSQGDVTHRAADARSTFGVTGAGVKIGVLSDGVSNLAASQANGNLGPVTVLSPGVGDEGTAMLEIIADLAPGAQLYFSTAGGGIATFAQHIRDLRAAGCDIIVDDVLYGQETPFQDGQVTASDFNGGLAIQAVKDVAASGALYFSSAGNAGRVNAGTSGTWEGNFVDGGAASGGMDGRLHHFGPATFNTVLTDSDWLVTLHWADPLGVSANDYDLYVLDSTGTNVVDASVDEQTGSQDPFEFVLGAFAGERLVVVKYSGADRFLHLSAHGGTLSVATGGEVHGHSATTAPNTFAIAATPACAGAGSTGPCTTAFTSSHKVETFSSDGPRRIFFTSTGQAITPGNFSATGGLVLAKPDITAADGVSTSVASFATFFGTSAAAPHAAAIAALVKSTQLTQTSDQVRTALLSTAIDIQAPGWDRDAGYGIVMAFASVQSVLGPPPATPTGLKLTRTGPDTAIATWNAVAGATSYTLKYASIAGGPRRELITVSGTSALVAGIMRGQTYYFTVSAANGGGSSADSPEVLVLVPLQDRSDDFDADGRSDLALWRPGNGTFSWLTSRGGYTTGDTKQWGVSPDKPFSGHMDGDGQADLIVWRPSTGTWFWLTSSAGYNYANQRSKDWGVSTDIPMTGDLDGDGKADLIVWRPSDGTWYWLTSSSGFEYASQRSKQWGNAALGDVPLLGDFDGDGKADLTVWRATSGTWYWLSSSSGFDYASQRAKGWGNQSLGDVPLIGDFDGDARGDLAVWRASTGTWFWLTSSSGFDYQQQGAKDWGSGSEGDVPMLGDLDGDGRSDLIVWRPAVGTWFWLRSSSGYTYSTQQQKIWGASGDIPMVR